MAVKTQEITTSWSTLGSNLSNDITEQYSSIGENLTNQTTTIANSAVNEISQVGSVLTTSASNISNSANSIANSLQEMTDAELMGEQLSNLGSSVLSATSTLLQTYIRQIVKYFTDIEYVSIGSIMGEIAPYATNPTEALSLLKAKTKKYINNVKEKYITTNSKDTWTSIVENYAKSISGDDDVQNALSQLSAVQIAGNSLEIAVNTINSVKSVINVLSPMLPLLRTTSLVAMSFWSGGATIAEATQKGMENAEYLVSVAASTAMYYVKKYIFGIKVPLPKIVVSGASIFSVRSAMTSFGDSKQATYLSMLFDNNYFESVSIQNSEWAEIISDVINKVDSIVTTSQSYYNEYIGIYEDTDTSSLSTEEVSSLQNWWSRYSKDITKNFMTSVVNESKLTVYTGYIQYKEENLKSYNVDYVADSYYDDSSDYLTDLRLIQSDSKKLLGL